MLHFNVRRFFSLSLSQLVLYLLWGYKNHPYVRQKQISVCFPPKLEGVVGVGSNEDKNKSKDSSV